MAFIVLLSLAGVRCSRDYASAPGLISSFCLIAFEQGAKVATVRSDGSDTRSFDAPSSVFSAPRWSPSGSVIALFTDSAGTGAYLSVMNADGSMRRRIARAGKAGAPLPVHLAWSPDGSRIAYADSQSALNVVDVQSGIARTVAPPPAVRPLWSPDGNRILFTRPPPDSAELARPFLVEADGSGLRALFSAAGEFIAECWCAQTNTIFLTGGPASFRDSTAATDVYSYVISSATLSKLTMDGVSGGAQSTADGTRLLIGQRQRSQIRIVTISAQGGAERYVTSCQGPALLRWSAIEGEIVLTSASSSMPGLADLSSVNVNGPAFRVLAQGTNLFFDVREVR